MELPCSFIAFFNPWTFMTTPLSFNPMSTAELLASLPRGARVADVGCYGWRLSKSCEDLGLLLVGFDRSEPPGRTGSALFGTMSDSQLAWGDGTFDAVVASHVIEHLDDPVALMSEMARVLAPGGVVWIEAPSELSCLAQGSDIVEDNRFVSFWDDPTHKRPYSPGALYRLMLSVGLYPLACGRVDEAIASSRAMGRRPQFAAPSPPRYVTLRGCPEGVDAAWRHVWPEVDLTEDDKAPVGAKRGAKI